MSSSSFPPSFPPFLPPPIHHFGFDELKEEEEKEEEEKEEIEKEEGEKGLEMLVDGKSKTEGQKDPSSDGGGVRAEGGGGGGGGNTRGATIKSKNETNEAF